MQSIFKSLMEGALGEDFNRISTRSSHKDLCKIIQGSLIERDLHARTSRAPRRTSQDRHKRTERVPLLIHGICKIFMQGPRREDFTRISTRSSHKDLCKIMQGTLRGCEQNLHTVAKCRQNSPNTAPATENDLQQISFWPMPANALATCRKCHACHADEKVWNVPRLPYKMDIAQKQTSTA